MKPISRYLLFFYLCLSLSLPSYAQKEFFAGDYGTFNTYEPKQLFLSTHIGQERNNDFIIYNVFSNVSLSYSPIKRLHTNINYRFHPSDDDNLIESYNTTPLHDFSVTIGYYNSSDFYFNPYKDKEIYSKKGININFGYQNLFGQYSRRIEASQNSFFATIGGFIKIGKIRIQANYRLTSGHTYKAEVTENFDRSRFIITELEQNPKIYLSQNLKLFYHTKNGAFYITRQVTQIQPVTFVEDENHWEYFYNPTYGIGYEFNLYNLIN
jgi:hypothetical protein